MRRKSMSELLSQLSTELCVVKSKKEGGEVSKKADLKRVPGGLELHILADRLWRFEFYEPNYAMQISWKIKGF